MFIYKDKIEDIKDKSIYNYKPYRYDYKSFKNTKMNIPIIRFTCSNSESIEYYNGKLFINHEEIKENIDTIKDLYNYISSNTSISMSLVSNTFQVLPTYLLQQFNNSKTYVMNAAESPLRYTRLIPNETESFLGLSKSIVDVFAYNFTNKKKTDVDYFTEGLFYFKPEVNLKLYVTEKYSDFIVYASLDNLCVTDGNIASELLSFVRRV